jgi:polar amino acid transport system ATP-binding protein
MSEGATYVRVSNVHKAFGGNEVLTGIDLSIGKGEVVCLLGPSGAGKSTLLRCVNGLSMPDKGYVTVAGELIGRRVRHGKLTNLSDREASLQRQSIGMVFQEFNLFPNLTVLRNLLLTPLTLRRDSKQALTDKAQALLTKVGLSDKAEAYPSQLSGGQQQRVAIARALMMDPELMLFDEPTSALDPQLTAEVLGTMQALANDGMTMITVTHEMSFAEKVATRVVFMADGTIVESAAPRDFFEHPSTSRARDFLGKER